MNQDFKPDWFSPPGSTLAMLMVQQGLSTIDLAERLGRDVTFVLRLLSGTERIDGYVASQLASSVGATAAFWRCRQAKFEDALTRTASSIPPESASEWLRSLPIREMVAAGWIGSTTHEQALRASLAYFGVMDPDEWRDRYAAHATKYAYRSSQTFASKLGALAAWLRQAELQAVGTPCAKWDPERFLTELEAIRGLTRLKSPSLFLRRLRSHCAAAGVAVVFIKAPAGCRASGATRFMSHDKAVMILSFRHLSDDHFWFSFFHEAGHLLLHKPEETFVDGDAAETTEKEREANAFAAGMLIPLSEHERLLDLKANVDQIVRFAVSIGVSPGIIVGQLQHHGIIGHAQFNGLKRRYTWGEVQQAIAELTP